MKNDFVIQQFGFINTAPALCRCLFGVSLEEFLKIDKELTLLKTLRGLNQAKSEVSNKKNTILIFSDKGELEVKSFRDAPDALRALFQLEEQMPHSDIVLVRADSSDGVRLAFRNYFSDARDYIRLIDTACEKLSGHAASKRFKESLGI